jgi:UDP-galactopyranose mutase
MFDYLIVGAGFSGAVLAERLASVGQRVIVADRRPHVGGNAYDHHDQAGVLVHKYGPHIFHTNSDRIYHYLSRFTHWRHYEHRVLSYVDGEHLPFPINADTIKKLYGLHLDERAMEAFFARVAVPVTRPRTFEDAMTSKIGHELFDKFIRNYTRKQWGLEPSELDASVAARVPARTNRDDRYFTDKYQVMPLHGFTCMFERMLQSRNITLLLQADYRDVAREVSFKNLIYTGPIDEYFNYCFGPLPYRSLRFEFKTEETECFQPGPVVNYPNDFDYTRVTEFKYLTGQSHEKTSVVYEFPTSEGDPYYPIPQAANTALYNRYKKLADELPTVTFVGRLGTYRYYNMDQCVGQALAVFDRMRGMRGSEGRVDAA